MVLKVGINGFGRIGRLCARAIIEQKRKDIELVAINDPGGNFFPLLKYDSIHGPAPFDVVRESDDWILIGGKRVHRFRDRDVNKLHWDREGVDIVLECTGKFRDAEGAQQHLNAGAKKVLISAPAQGDIKTIVYGVNHENVKKKDNIVSNASCTTNALAPLAYALHKEIGIERGFMTTIHSYTGDQNLVDGSHKDPLRARSAAMNMIPTSTGAAKAVGLVLPELAGKLDGTSVRVPTPNVSLVDLKFEAKKKTTINDVNAAVIKHSKDKLKGILKVYDDPCVSGDFNHDPHSSIFSLNDTKVVDEKMVRVAAWYDNEWGFSCRMLDTALKMHDVGYS
ncbi:MAG: type I glyceraldehyde-3-phosphate dehydrogenase [Pseudomonadota bacterium]